MSTDDPHANDENENAADRQRDELFAEWDAQDAALDAIDLDEFLDTVSDDDVVDVFGDDDDDDDDDDVDFDDDDDNDNIVGGRDLDNDEDLLRGTPDSELDFNDDTGWPLAMQQAANFVSLVDYWINHATDGCRPAHVIPAIQQIMGELHRMLDSIASTVVRESLNTLDVQPQHAGLPASVDEADEPSLLVADEAQRNQPYRLRQSVLRQLSYEDDTADGDYYDRWRVYNQVRTFTVVELQTQLNWLLQQREHMDWNNPDAANISARMTQEIRDIERHLATQHALEIGRTTQALEAAGTVQVGINAEPILPENHNLVDTSPAVRAPIADVDELRTWVGDIRDTLTANALQAIRGGVNDDLQQSLNADFDFNIRVPTLAESITGNWHAGAVALGTIIQHRVATAAERLDENPAAIDQAIQDTADEVRWLGWQHVQNNAAIRALCDQAVQRGNNSLADNTYRQQQLTAQRGLIAERNALLHTYEMLEQQQLSIGVINQRNATSAAILRLSMQIRRITAVVEDTRPRVDIALGKLISIRDLMLRIGTDRYCGGSEELESIWQTIREDLDSEIVDDLTYGLNFDWPVGQFTVQDAIRYVRELKSSEREELRLSRYAYWHSLMLSTSLSDVDNAGHMAALDFVSNTTRIIEDVESEIRLLERLNTEIESFDETQAALMDPSLGEEWTPEPPVDLSRNMTSVLDNPYSDSAAEAFNSATTEQLLARRRNGEEVLWALPANDSIVYLSVPQLMEEDETLRTNILAAAYGGRNTQLPSFYINQRRLIQTILVEHPCVDLFSHLPGSRHNGRWVQDRVIATLRSEITGIASELANGSVVGEEVVLLRRQIDELSARCDAMEQGRGMNNPAVVMADVATPQIEARRPEAAEIEILTNAQFEVQERRDREDAAVRNNEPDADADICPVLELQVRVLQDLIDNGLPPGVTLPAAEIVDGETLTAHGSYVLVQSVVGTRLVAETQQLQSLLTGDFTIGTGSINRARRTVDELTAQMELLTQSRDTTAQAPVQAAATSVEVDLTGSRYTWHMNATPVRLCTRYNDLCVSRDRLSRSDASRANIEQQIRELECVVQLRTGLDYEIVAGSGMSVDQVRQRFISILESRRQVLLHMDASNVDPAVGRRHYDAAGALAARINRLNNQQQPATSAGLEPVRRPWPNPLPQPNLLPQADAAAGSVTREQMEEARRVGLQRRPVPVSVTPAPVAHVRDLYRGNSRDTESLRLAINARLESVLHNSNDARMFEAAIQDTCDDVRELADRYMSMSRPIQARLRAQPRQQTEGTERERLEQAAAVILRNYRHLPVEMRHAIDHVVNIARGQFATRTPVSAGYGANNSPLVVTRTSTRLHIELPFAAFHAVVAAHIADTTPPGTVNVADSRLLVEHVWASLSRNWHEPGGGADLLLGAVAAVFADNSGAFRVAPGAAGVRLPATRVRTPRPAQERQRVLMIDRVEPAANTGEAQ